MFFVRFATPPSLVHGINAPFGRIQCTRTSTRYIYLVTTAVCAVVLVEARGHYECTLFTQVLCLFFLYRFFLVFFAGGRLLVFALVIW